MQQQSNERLVKAIVVTAEVCGHEISPLAAKVMVRDLRQHPIDDVLNALQRCRRECKGRLTLSAVISRLPGQHLGADEAWAIASQAADEAATVVWTNEMAEAFGVARSLMRSGDGVAARIAFRDAYVRIVAETDGKPVWNITAGHDALARAAAIERAVLIGRLPAEVAERHLPGIGHTLRLPRSGSTSTARDLMASALPSGSEAAQQ